jgi:Na+-driven multidrug efflux pump
MLPRVLKIGIPSGIQNSVTSLANLVVQASINLFGATAMAGNGAFTRIQGFALIPVTSFALALTTFTGQNLGAGEYDRVKKGARFGIIFCMLLSESIGLLLYYNAATLLSFFSRDPEVIAVGIQKAQIASKFLFAVALSHTMAGIFRGAGKSIVPMAVMLSIWCIFRVLYIKLALSYLMDIRLVFWAYPITWMMSSIIFLVYYFTSGWMQGKRKLG